MADEEKILAAAIDYINDNAARLHGVPVKDLNIGLPVTVDNILASAVRETEAVLVIDRKEKGAPKYIISLAELETARTAAKPEAAAKKGAK